MLVKFLYSLREIFCSFKFKKGQSKESIKREVDNLLTEFNLSKKANTKAGKLSGGEKRKLVIAIAYCGESEIIILDEPTVGVDIESKEEISIANENSKNKDENDKISQNTFCNEHNILEILNNLNSKYFPHLYEYKERGRIRYHNDRIAYKDYIVTDYFCKGNLLIYIEQTGKGLEEKYAKVIFSEILKGVKKFHTEKICHLDLHMRNILLNFT